MLTTPEYARMMAKVLCAPSRSAAHPAMTRPGGASQVAELASNASCAVGRPNDVPTLGLNAAVENHIRNAQKNATVATTSRSTVLVICEHLLCGLHNRPRPFESDRTLLVVRFARDRIARSDRQVVRLRVVDRKPDEPLGDGVVALDHDRDGSAPRAALVGSPSSRSVPSLAATTTSSSVSRMDPRPHRPRIAAVA